MFPFPRYSSFELNVPYNREENHQHRYEELLTSLNFYLILILD